MLTCKSAGDAQKYEELHNHIFAFKDIMCILQQKDVWLSRLSPVTHHTGYFGCCVNLNVTPHNLPSVLRDQRTRTPFTRQCFTTKHKSISFVLLGLHDNGVKKKSAFTSERWKDWKHCRDTESSMKNKVELILRVSPPSLLLSPGLRVAIRIKV